MFDHSQGDAPIPNPISVTPIRGNQKRNPRAVQVSTTAPRKRGIAGTRKKAISGEAHHPIPASSPNDRDVENARPSVEDAEGHEQGGDADCEGQVAEPVLGGVGAAEHRDRPHHHAGQRRGPSVLDQAKGGAPGENRSRHHEDRRDDGEGERVLTADRERRSHDEGFDPSVGLSPRRTR